MNNKCVAVIPIYNPEKEWIGNISVDKETLEIEDNLKYGYTIAKSED